jgi:hypothetical protein
MQIRTPPHLCDARPRSFYTETALRTYRGPIQPWRPRTSLAVSRVGRGRYRAPTPKPKRTEAAARRTARPSRRRHVPTPTRASPADHTHGRAPRPEQASQQAPAAQIYRRRPGQPHSFRTSLRLLLRTVPAPSTAIDIDIDIATRRPRVWPEGTEPDRPRLSWLSVPSDSPARLPSNLVSAP